MTKTAATGLTRRSFLSAGSLLVAFSLTRPATGQLAGGGEGRAGPPIVAPNLAGDLKSFPFLDAWIRIDADAITVFTGKAELGQGIRTALTQVAAEELDVPFESITLVTTDTTRTPDEGVTSGSHSMQDSGMALLNAAANVRMLLTREAALAWNIAPQQVTTTGKAEMKGPAGQLISYQKIAANMSLHVEAIAGAPLRRPDQFRSMGREIGRVDIPAKVSGGLAYVHDMRLPGMLHARVVRGPSMGTQLSNPDLAAIAAMPGVVKIVRNGEFCAIVAESEWTAVKALRRLQNTTYKRSEGELPKADMVATLKALPARDIVILDTHDPVAPGARTAKARYTRPWLSHGSIGPSCAVALYDQDEITIWTHSQGAFDVRRVAAELLGMPPEKVRAIHREGAGCYGQNGADDVSAEAALIAKSIPGRPIRLQWMREQEFGWEPLGPGMVTELEASLDADNRIVSWNHEIWSNTHSTRPVGAGGVLVGGEVIPGFPAPGPEPIPMPEGDGSRNSNPLYALPNMHVIYHFLKDMPLRVSALRSLGAHLNVFSIECMLDELAEMAGVDPLIFRLNHMKDERAHAVMTEATERFGWSKRVRRDGCRGCGMAFARYKNIGAYLAIVMEVEVDRDTGNISVRRVVAATDCGQPVNPSGIRNQIEGGIIQSLSWTTREEVTFSATHRTSFDWSAYPIIRFEHVPESIDVHIVDRPSQPFLGVAECAQGPTAAALANAVADATGLRLRDMPLSPERLKRLLI
jgi:nicotinate dehydrogenase subunit B